MADDSKELVIHIEQSDKYGTAHVTAIPMQIDPKTGTPVNLLWSDWDSDGREYADMQLVSGVTEYGGNTYVEMPEYRDVYCFGLRRAEVMTKTLKRLHAALAKAEARECGDMFTVFAKAIGAKRVVWHKAGQTCSWLRDYEWHFETIARGRDLFREWLKDAEIAHPKNAKKGLVE